MSTLILSALCTLSLIAPPIDIGTQRQLFLDHHLVESMDGVNFELGEPRDAGPVFQFDQPWEGPFCGYSTVIRDGDQFLLYYRGLPEAGADGSNRETTCVALSNDGVNWTRPNLSLHTVDGSRENNVILANVAPVTHNFSPFLDTNPNCDPNQRFKGLGGSEHSGLIAWTSPDGLRWTRVQEAPVVTGGMFDSQNVAFYSESEGMYVCYLRTWTGEGYSGLRTVSRSTSNDFINWSEPVAMDFGDGELEHIYTNQTHPYFRAPQHYVAVAARFMPGRQVLSDADAERLGVNPRYFKDCSDAVLMTSRGGNTYDRTYREAFIRPGIGLENWVSRSNYPALNIVQTGPEEMSLYVNQNYAQPTAELRRYTMRLDGLASARAGHAGGSLITKPIQFVGDRLSVNFATSAAGGLRVELQDADGTPLPGYTLADSIELIGNEIERDVVWKGGADVSKLAGKPIRIRFEMKDVDLYSWRFIDDIEINSVERIWDQAPHSAFTDLLRVNDRLYCTFREGDGHVYGADGRIRIIMRDGDGPWDSVALLAKPGVDLRDPKLCLLPDGRIMMNCGGSFYDDRTLVKQQSMASFSTTSGDTFQPVEPVVIDETVRSTHDWLWRVTWHDDIGYGTIYQRSPQDEWHVHLVSTTNGIDYTHVTQLPVLGVPNETTLRFTDSDEMVALIRREGGDHRAVLGRAQPPYTNWTFTTLPRAIGGPNMIAAGQGDWWASGRHYGPDQTQTFVARLDQQGQLHEEVLLPSGGDTSYPGLVRIGDTLLVSYYSSHEDKTAIYLAELSLPAAHPGEEHME